MLDYHWIMVVDPGTKGGDNDEGNVTLTVDFSCKEQDYLITFAVCCWFCVVILSILITRFNFTESFLYLGWCLQDILVFCILGYNILFINAFVIKLTTYIDWVTGLKLWWLSSRARPTSTSNIFPHTYNQLITFTVFSQIPLFFLEWASSIRWCGSGWICRSSNAFVCICDERLTEVEMFWFYLVHCKNCFCYFVIIQPRCNLQHLHSKNNGS